MKSRRYLAVAFIALSSAILFSCQKKTSTAPKEKESMDDEAPSGGKKDLEATLVKLDASGFKDFAIDVKPFHTDAHKKYLADPMKFQALPDQDLPKGATAVVGSKVCVLYPNAKIETAADLGRLPAGVPIPFGTIVPIKGEKIADPDNKERYGMFQFQDNWNWFYRTTYKGKEGLVFGADLYGLNDSNEANRISARLYQTGGKGDAFYPVVGYHELPPEVAARLERDRLAFQAVGKDEYDLSGYRTELMPDDMEAASASLVRLKALGGSIPSS